MTTRETQIHEEQTRRADPAGNERLTAMTGAVLLVLFVAECLTLLNIGNLLTLHVFLGMLLLGPVGLKIGSTLWRFTRYYTGSAAYVRRGPPAPLQRVTGPFVILTTVAVLGTGIMLAVEGPGNGSWGRLHHLSFFLWAFVISSTWPRTSRGCPACCRAGWDDARHLLAARPTRWLLLCGSLAAGLGLAFATYHLSAKFGGSGSILP